VSEILISSERFRHLEEIYREEGDVIRNGVGKRSKLERKRNL